MRGVDMSFRRYTRKLYHRPKANLLHLKARLVTSEVAEALFYKDARRGHPLKGHYNIVVKLRTTHHYRKLLRILGAWCKLADNHILSNKDTLQRAG